ncbi:glucosaminidase domain-containing protein [Pleionea sediminis]|uniref:glucosaminidase domain-containing protein n=1 Tax=Pleionea sediminis TaxID=2569479 RepID=UPI00197B8C1F|nr:glucosaminidase domain-containing protein [Pleionea sediminis]
MILQLNLISGCDIFRTFNEQFLIMYNFDQENDQTPRMLIISVIVTAVLFLVFFYSPSPNDPQPEQVVELPDFSRIEDIKQRKEAFFSFLRPIVQKLNLEIRNDRNRLIELAKEYSSDGQFKRANEGFLSDLSNKYRLDMSDFENKLSMIDELKLRVQVIPESLVLAQAANESSWGRSRFAREGNNLFGQWCFKPGCGLIPKSRPEGKQYEVAVFDSPVESVWSYMLNLNSFAAYESFRERRRSLLRNNEKLLGATLAEELINYSTRREEYVKEIQTMIRQNSLE